MDENENPKPGTGPASNRIDRKTLLMVVTFVSGLVLLIALNMK
jgi:hypothetical protein